MLSCTNLHPAQLTNKGQFDKCVKGGKFALDDNFFCQFIHEGRLGNLSSAWQRQEDNLQPACQWLLDKPTETSKFLSSRKNHSLKATFVDRHDNLSLVFRPTSKLRLYKKTNRKKWDLFNVEWKGIFSTFPTSNYSDGENILPELRYTPEKQNLAGDFIPPTCGTVFFICRLNDTKIYLLSIQLFYHFNQRTTGSELNSYSVTKN